MGRFISAEDRVRARCADAILNCFGHELDNILRYRLPILDPQAAPKLQIPMLLPEFNLH